MKLLKIVKDNDLIDLFLSGNFGLEKEGLRVKLPVDLATSNHPDSLGDQESHPYIKTDYAEAMPELITPPLSPYLNAYKYLQTLSYVLLTNLEEDEYIWPFSVPCQTLDDDQSIKISQTKDINLNQYRLYTAAKYGRKRQLINGIHINYSFNEDFLKQLFELQEEFTNLEKLCDELYLKLVSNFLRYQWLIVYLFGASPIAEDNFFDCPFFTGRELPNEAIRSLRNSEYGFVNNPEISVRYDSIEHYKQDLQTAMDKNFLRKEREYYGGVRLRSIVEKSKALLGDEIQYVEIRSFDNDPYHPTGIDKETLQFIHLFFLTMVSIPEKASTEQINRGSVLTKTVAKEHPYSKVLQYEEGVWLLGEMQRTIEMLELDQSYSSLVEKALELLNHPEKTIAGRIYGDIESGFTLLTLGERLGWAHKIKTIGKEELPGFEHLSLSHQQELYNILQKGLDLPSWLFEKA